MGIEDIASAFDINKIMDYMMDIGFKIVKYPFDIWLGLPSIVRYIVYGIIIAIAILITYVTWKYRDAWRYFS